MTCDIHLNPFTLDKGSWEAVRSRFAEIGVDVPDAPSGTISQNGVVADFTWDGGELNIHVTRKPMLVTQDYVVRKLTEFINEA